MSAPLNEGDVFRIVNLLGEFRSRAVGRLCWKLPDLLRKLLFERDRTVPVVMAEAYLANIVSLLKSPTLRYALNYKV